MGRPADTDKWEQCRHLVLGPKRGRKCVSEAQVSPHAVDRYVKESVRLYLSRANGAHVTQKVHASLPCVCVCVCVWAKDATDPTLVAVYTYACPT
mmetsp:Transcript_16707/g.31621  ORF Transcript_16707/g.31621 Transcript_16707/m.31621 type:complete len:95 (-) Transcript_16707:49-333(-)